MYVSINDALSSTRSLDISGFCTTIPGESSSTNFISYSLPSTNRTARACTTLYLPEYSSYNTILSSILITPVMAKEKLYAINSGSLTGSHSVMTAAWANDLAEDYDVQIVQAKGCAKTEAILKKLEGQHAIYNYSSNWNSKETCKNVAPTSDSLVYADAVVGLVFTKGEHNSSFLTDNISVAYTNDSTAVWLEEVESVNNVKFNR